MAERKSSPSIRETPLLQSLGPARAFDPAPGQGATIHGSARPWRRSTVSPAHHVFGRSQLACHGLVLVGGTKCRSVAPKRVYREHRQIFPAKQGLTQRIASCRAD